MTANNITRAPTKKAKRPRGIVQADAEKLAKLLIEAQHTAERIERRLQRHGSACKVGLCDYCALLEVVGDVIRDTNRLAVSVECATPYPHNIRGVPPMPVYRRELP